MWIIIIEPIMIRTSYGINNYKDLQATKKPAHYPQQQRYPLQQ